jgi:hypothetical protein
VGSRVWNGWFLCIFTVPNIFHKMYYCCSKWSVYMKCHINIINANNFSVVYIQSSFYSSLAVRLPSLLYFRPFHQFWHYSVWFSFDLLRRLLECCCYLPYTNKNNDPDLTGLSSLKNVVMEKLLLTSHLWSNCCFIFKVCKSMHHHMIQINRPTRCNNFSSLLLDVYVQLNMFWASSCPSSGTQQLQ